MKRFTSKSIKPIRKNKMRDVFKYFKHVRSLQEDKGAEKAAELGYQHQARGVYLDPKTQKRYKNVGDK